MCIRVRFAPRDQITDVYDVKRQIIVLPEDLSLTAVFTLRALRYLLRELGIEQDVSGALCWCGDEVELPAIPTQRRNNEVMHRGA